MQKFVHLHTHSHFSLLDGLSKIEQIIERAKEYKMNSLALTDHGNLYGAIEFYKKAKEAGIKPILGVETYLAPNGMLNKRPKIDELRYHLVLLAKNKEGWKNIIKLVTAANLEGFYYKPRIDKELLSKYKNGIICLSGCRSGEIANLILKNKEEEAEKTALWYKENFGEDFYLEIQPHNSEALNQKIADLGKKLNIKIVATKDSHYLNLEDKKEHEILLSIQTNAKLAEEERMSLKKFNLHFCSPEEMYKEMRGFEYALEETEKVAEKCNLEIELNKTLLPKFPVENGMDSFEYLKKLVEEKVKLKYKDITKEIKDRIEYELEIIKKTGFSDYFLIVQDYVNFAKEHGIVVGPGRGSAAGSIISYILGITAIDPLKYGLLFERFLNPERVQSPDIDVDFTDERRDEVFAYIREKYGNNSVAQIITFGMMMAKAAVRDVTRALGYPYSFGDKIAKLVPANQTLQQSIENIKELKDLYENNEDAKKILDSAIKLEGTARHASVHACGIVIAPKDITEFIPLQRAPQEKNSTITQFEMHSVEDLGLLKMDLLGLKNLTIIEETLRNIKEIRNIDIDIEKLPLDDKKTFELLQAGNTTGVFQLESSGMKKYLKELKPTELEDIIVMISLYRPGPMDLIPSYIKRKLGKEKINYIHPKLEPILKNTYGIGIYQEQMMMIARNLAGFTLAEADTLRKAIGKKIKKLLDVQKEKLIAGMVKNGIDKKIAEEIWEMFPPFARYGFNRSHAASYAMISYQTAYLKANYPIEFTAALLNISGTDIERINFLINEAKKMNIKIAPPDINLSSKKFTIDIDKDSGLPNGTIRFGLLAIKNIGENIADKIIEERTIHGPYEDISDFLSRIHDKDLNKKSLESLIKVGAFDSLNIDRGTLITNIDKLLTFNQLAKKTLYSNQNSLFAGEKKFGKLNLKKSKDIDEKTITGWEKELLGLYLTSHPVNEYAKKIKNNGNIKNINYVLNMPKNGQKSPKILLMGVISKTQKIITKNGEPMIFATLEDTNGSIEMLVFNSTMKNNPDIWKENNVVIAEGCVSWKNGETKFICDRVKEL